jgi:photosystem II stability/assembly factor-like uncharacterized protein
LLIRYGAFANARRASNQDASSALDASLAADETNPEYVENRLEFLNRFFGTGPGKVSRDAYAAALAAAQALPPSPLLQHRTFAPLTTTTWTFPVPPPLANDFGGGASAMILAIAVDPTNADIVYAGSHAGLAKSTDGGDHWTYISDGFTSQNIRSITIDPNSPNIVYAGTGAANFFGVGIYRSTDSGATWKQLGKSEFSGKAVGKIAIDPTNSAKLYASVTRAADQSHAVWKSTDSGSHWVSIKSSGQAPWWDYANPLYDIAIQPFQLQPPKVYISAPDGVWSGDGSGSWTYLHNIPDTLATSCLALGQSPLSGLYLGYHVGGNPDYVAIEKSTDQGSTWTSVSSSPGNLYFFAPDPVHLNRLFVGGGSDLRYSLDSGANWLNSCEPGTTCVHPDIHSIAFCPSNTQRNYLGTDGGIYRADYNGIDPYIDWINKNQNLAGALIGGMSMSSDDHMVIGTQDNGTQLHAGNNPPWTMLCGGDGGGRPQIDQNNSSKLYYPTLSYGALVCAGQPCGYGNITRWVSGLKTDITPRVAPNSACGEHQINVPALFMAPADSTRVIVGFQNVYRSLDSGSNWTRLGGRDCSVDPNDCGIDRPNGIIRGLYEAPGDTNVIYAIAHDFGKLYVTTNANQGASWTDRTPGLPGGINAVVVPPGVTNSQTAYAACNLNVYRTTNTGMTWTNLNAPANAIYHDVAIDPVNPQHVFAASHLGVFSSTDGGTTWANMSAGIPVGMEVSSLSLNATSRHLAASTYGRGAYILDLGEVRQAESGVLTGCYIQADPNASGGYRVDGISSAGDNVAFNNFTQTTQITIRYASPYTGTFGLYVSGTRVASIPITATGPYPQGWTIFTEKIINVSIPANVTVKFQYDTGDVGINLDYVLIAR